MYTNLTELFHIHFELIIFFSKQFLILCLTFNFFIFITPGLYKNEYFLLKNELYKLIHLYFFIYILIIPYLFSLFITFFSINTESFIFLELKINNFLTLFIKFYYNTISWFFLIFIFYRFKFRKKTNFNISRKYYYIFSFLFLIIENHLFFVFLIFLINYEINLFIYFCKFNLR